eukprot:1880188-Rhodomonas_salina.1
MSSRTACHWGKDSEGKQCTGKPCSGKVVCEGKTGGGETGQGNCTGKFPFPMKGVHSWFRKQTTP